MIFSSYIGNCGKVLIFTMFWREMAAPNKPTNKPIFNPQKNGVFKAQCRG
jgi:hypothetical protein